MIVEANDPVVESPTYRRTYRFSPAPQHPRVALAEAAPQSLKNQYHAHVEPQGQARA
jgi:hypothetical protein